MPDPARHPSPAGRSVTILPAALDPHSLASVPSTGFGSARFTFRCVLGSRAAMDSNTRLLSPAPVQPRSQVRAHPSCAPSLPHPACLPRSVPADVSTGSRRLIARGSAGELEEEEGLGGAYASESEEASEWEPESRDSSQHGPSARLANRQQR